MRAQAVPRVLLFWAALASCACAAHPISESGPRAPLDEDREPALEFSLEHAGSATPIDLDRPAVLKTATGDVDVTLRMKPSRTLRLVGLSLAYPAHFGFEADTASQSARTWTLDGNNVVLIITRFPSPSDPDRMRTGLVAGMRAQYGLDNSATTPVSSTFGGIELEGTRIDTQLGGAALVQEVYAFRTAGGVYAMIVQHSPIDEDAGRDEYAAFLDLLDRSFAIEAPQS
jgi:hypothetical protein